MKKYIFHNETNNQILSFLKTHIVALSGTTKLVAAIENKKITIGNDDNNNSFHNTTQFTPIDYSTTSLWSIQSRGSCM